jgi:hypothetical protein
MDNIKLGLAKCFTQSKPYVYKYCKLITSFLNLYTKSVLNLKKYINFEFGTGLNS